MFLLPYMMDAGFHLLSIKYNISHILLFVLFNEPPSVKTNTTGSSSIGQTAPPIHAQLRSFSGLR